MKEGMVYLVGAGPGDPGLLTLKGRECIEKADVIIYDRLVNPQLLAYARSTAELIYAGKSPAGHVMSQTEINQMLIERARSGQVVVRLKGGDPFVFGRGGEEAEVLAENGIAFEVVPGITSATAAPAYAGIPVTHRHYTSDLAIITGNEDPLRNDSRIPWDKPITQAGTLIFLMGMNNLAAIVQHLLEQGRPDETPVALVRWGTWAEQQTLVGTLADIVNKAVQSGFTNPAVIIVGEVVNLRAKLQWLEKKPLFGKRVLVTRARNQASGISQAIATLGGDVLQFPTISIVEPEDYQPLDRALKQLGSYRWLIFTSSNGVKFFFQRLIRQGGDIRELKGVNLCAIGPGTKQALESYGLKVDFVPSEYRAEEIVAGLRNKIQPGDRVLLPRADIARKVLPLELKRLGMQVDEAVAYRTIPGGGNATLIRNLLREGRIHIITFTSSSTVHNFVTLLKEPQLPRLLKDVTIASIGPVTSSTLRKLGLKVDIEARQYTVEGLVEAIVNSQLAKGRTF